MIKKNLFLAIVLFFTVVTSTLAHEINTPKTSVIHIQAKQYVPNTLTINQGDTVVFENTTQEDRWPASNIHPTHSIYADFDPKKPIVPGEMWRFTFTKPGIWMFHDHLKPEFTGSITVNDTNTTTTAPQERQEKQNFITQLWQRFIHKILALIGKEDLANKPKSTPRPYNDTIEKNATTIYQDQNELYSYVKKFGPKQTVQHLYELAPQFGDCHQPAHDAGHFAFEIYGDKAFQTCSAECHSGCYHGATEAYFKEHGTNNLAKNLEVICNSELNPFFSHQCVHGIGHGLMAWSNYEIHEALNNCDLVGVNLPSCYTGVFMENIVGGLAQDTGHQTKYLNEDPQYPCTVVDEKYKGACYFYQTSRMMQLFGGDFTKVAQSCIDSPETYRASCFESMGRDVGGVHRNQPINAIAACDAAKDLQNRLRCLSGAVQDTFWDPNGAATALSFCKLLKTQEEKQGCYNTIIPRAKDVLPDTTAKQKFCAEVETDYQQNCQSNLLAVN